MRKLVIAVIAALVLGSSAAFAHQPVVLLDTDTTAAKGPLLVDGTVSFAIRASFTKSGQKKAFRALFKEGDVLAVQYLIVDKKPENALKSSQLPIVIITGPGGFKTTIKLNERTKFYEPYGGTNYLYLARYSGIAKAGIYSFVITSKAKAGITLGVGQQEIPGEVVRGAYVAPTP
jgi:ribosomal protein L23